MNVEELADLKSKHPDVSLSSFEDNVVDLYLSRNTYNSIAGLLNTTRKAVDNALQRVRVKYEQHVHRYEHLKDRRRK